MKNYPLILLLGLMLGMLTQTTEAQMLDVDVPATTSLLEGKWSGSCSIGTGRLFLRRQNKSEASLSAKPEWLVGELVLNNRSKGESFLLQGLGEVRRGELVFDSFTHSTAFALRRSEQRLVLDGEYQLHFKSASGICKFIKSQQCIVRIIRSDRRHRSNCGTSFLFPTA